MRRGGYAGRGPSNLALVRRSEDRKDERRHDAALVLQRKSRRDRLCRALEAAAVAARSRMDVDVSSDESVESAKLGSTSGDFEAFLVDDSGVTEKKMSVIQVMQSTKARILYEALAAWRDRVDSDDEYPLSDESDVAPRAPSPVASRVTSPVKPSPITLNAAASLIELAADEPPAPSVPVSSAELNRRGSAASSTDRRASASSAESPAELNRRRTLQLRDSFGVEELEDFDDDHSGDARSRSDSGADLSSCAVPYYYRFNFHAIDATKRAQAFSRYLAHLSRPAQVPGKWRRPSGNAGAARLLACLGQPRRFVTVVTALLHLRAAEAAVAAAAAAAALAAASADVAVVEASRALAQLLER
jgi:hypothetical protein